MDEEQQENRRILTDKEIIEISKKDRAHIYHNPDGRVAHNGLIFKNEQELEKYFKMYVKIGNTLLKIIKPYLFLKRLFSRKK